MDPAARGEAIARWRRMVDELAADAARTSCEADPARLRALIVLHPDNAGFDRAARVRWYRHGALGRLWRRVAGRPPLAAPPVEDRGGLPAPLRRMQAEIDAIARDWGIEDRDRADG